MHTNNGLLWRCRSAGPTPRLRHPPTMKWTKPMLTSVNRRSLLKLAAAATATVGASSMLAIARPALASSRAALEEAGAGAWRTWFLQAGSDLRLPPPPSSVAELSGVRGMLSNLDEAARDRITYWGAGPPPYRWNAIA